jgi:hypothetical protein
MSGAIVRTVRTSRTLRLRNENAWQGVASRGWFVAMVTLLVRFAVIFGSLAGVGVWALYLSWLAKGGRGRFERYAWRVVRGVFDSAR